MALLAKIYAPEFFNWKTSRDQPSNTNIVLEAAFKRLIKLFRMRPRVFTEIESDSHFFIPK
jgi:hypothetical protein